MGSKTIEVNRHLVKDIKASEKDVTIGLERTDEAINCFIDSVLSGNNIPAKKQEDFRKKLSIMKYAKKKANEKDGDDIQVLDASIGGDYCFFIFYFKVNDEDKKAIDIAYQLLTGHVEIEQAHKIKKGKIVEGSVEKLSPEETKSIIKTYLNLENPNENYLKKAIENEK